MDSPRPSVALDDFFSSLERRATYGWTDEWMEDSVGERTVSRSVNEQSVSRIREWSVGRLVGWTGGRSVRELVRQKRQDAVSRRS